MEQSNPLAKKKNKRKRNNRKKPQTTTNGFQVKAFTNDNSNFNYGGNERQQMSSPRPTDFKKNPKFEIKRCSGSEVEDFHTPNNEYPPISGQEFSKSPDYSYDSQWQELGYFNRSNLEEIPEQDKKWSGYSHNHYHYNKQSNGQENMKLGSFPYRQVKNKPSRNRSNNINKDIRTKTVTKVENGSYPENEVHENLNDKPSLSEEIRESEEKEKPSLCIVTETIQECINIDLNVNREDPDFLQNPEVENHQGHEESICSEESNIINNKLDNIDDMKNDNDNIDNIENNENDKDDLHVNNTNNDSLNETEMETNYEETMVCDNQTFDSIKYCAESLAESETDHNHVEIILQENDNFVNKETEEDNDKEADCRDIEKSSNELVIEEEIDNSNTSECNKWDTVMEDIRWTDENLSDEILPVYVDKIELRVKYMTFSERSFNNNLKQSATTITNVTSISDEHINLSSKEDFQEPKINKKSKRFIKQLLSRFTKRKSKPMEKEKEPITNEGQFPDHNEYFDDNSIDCNSNTKGLEIDSNKALKSFDESINNIEDIKHMTDEESLDEKQDILNNEELNADNFESESTSFIKSCSITDDTSYVEKDSHTCLSLECVEKPEVSDSEKLSGQFYPESYPVEQMKEENLKNKKFFNITASAKNNKDSKKGNNKNFTVKNPKENHIDGKIIDHKNLSDEDNIVVDGSKTEIDHSETASNKNCEEIISNTELTIQMESLDTSFNFLNEFDKDSPKRNQTQECLKINKIDDTEDNFIFQQENLEITLDANNTVHQLTLITTTKTESSPATIPRNLKSQNSKAREKRKKRFLTLFFNKKNEQTSPEPESKLKAKSLTSVNTEGNLDKNRNIQLDRQLLKEFDEAISSLLPSPAIQEDKVICKNKNEYPLQCTETNQTNIEISYVNDDYLFPDAITPSKIIHFDPEQFYNVPFIDDPMIIAQDSLTIFKGENKRPLIFSEFSAPFASSETLFISDQLNHSERSQKSLSPNRDSKRPFNVFMSLLSRTR